MFKFDGMKFRTLGMTLALALAGSASLLPASPAHAQEPEPYLNSRILEEVKRYRSAYELSIIVMNRKPSGKSAERRRGTAQAGRRRSRS